MLNRSQGKLIISGYEDWVLWIPYANNMHWWIFCCHAQIPQRLCLKEERHIWAHALAKFIEVGHYGLCHSDGSL